MHGIITDLIHAKYHVMYFWLLACCIVLKKDKVDELLKERHNSIANALELHLSCTNLCYAFHVILQQLRNKMTYIVNAMTAEGISSHDNDPVCMAYSIICAGRVKPILTASAKQLLWKYIFKSFIHQATM